MLAGYLRKKSVELVKCETNDLEVPAKADHDVLDEVIVRVKETVIHEVVAFDARKRERELGVGKLFDRLIVKEEL